MTTPTSPDGQPQIDPTTSPNPTTGDDAPIRNWGDVKRLLGEVVPGREEIKDLRSTLDALVGKIGELAAPAKVDPPAGNVSPEAQQLAALTAKINELDEAKRSGDKAERRRKITAAIVDQAQPAHREAIRTQLAAMAFDGEVDLFAEDIAGESARALAKIRARTPGAFAPASDGRMAPAGQHEMIPAGVELHELTREQLERMSPEDFAKARKASRTSGLAV